ncbi:hypothetical protein B6I21_01720 [candidate division KSB1 bacterium 4572_119]|nr:MAG: hypothetical protein B6I21_01720 [candidate division KSB1 bacterium 4572_119]
MVLNTGGASFPTATVGDMDGDGNYEILLGMPYGSGYPAPDANPQRFYVFESSAAGFPDTPTATWNFEAPPGSNTRPSGMSAGDIDGDGVQEIACGFRAFSGSTTNDALMIFSLIGQFADIFTQFNIEVMDTTADKGSVYQTAITDIDNDGMGEALFMSYSYDHMVFWEATGADAYERTIVIPGDGLWASIHGTYQFDVDGDGNNEIFNADSRGYFGLVHDVTDVTTIDESNFTKVAYVWDGGLRGGCCGDYDNDGNADFFFNGNWDGAIIRAEYKGEGAITDSASYTYEMIFQADTTGGGQRMYASSFPSDVENFLCVGNTNNDMTGNGLPELLIGLETGDSLSNYVVLVDGNTTTGVEIRPGEQTLDTYVLSQNYPNPFNPTTAITYSIPKEAYVTLKVYNMLGEEVKTLVSGKMTQGNHIANWDGTNNSGSMVTSGQYIYRLDVEGRILSKSMVLMK